MKTLVAGWFSFEDMGASAGDLMARDLACEWLVEAGREIEVAVAEPFREGVDWRSVDPASLSQIVFVCGPFGNGPPLTEFLERFSGVPLVGLDLSLLDPLETWNPFSHLWERDSSRTSRPDIAFLSQQARVPIVGTVLIDEQPEYGPDAQQSGANAAVHRLLAARDVAVVPIDTRLDCNKTGLRSARQIESLISRMDVVVTTRLHGTVLALKNGVPAVVIDSVRGGAKVLRQARSIGWPVARTVGDLTDAGLAKDFEYCLTAEARENARSCGARAIHAVELVRADFIRQMRRLP